MPRWKSVGGPALLAVSLAAVSLSAVRLSAARPVTSRATGATSWWHPGPLTSWQYALGEPFPIAVPTNIGNVEVYDIDEGNEAGVTRSEVATSVAAVHASGAKAICYVEAGGWESYRADASEYSSGILGNTVSGYSNERYIDIRQWSDDPGPSGLTLSQILTARFQLCADEGFDGVETDLDDTYTDSTGFPLTMADEETFMTEMAGVIHGLGMAWFLKNDINGDSLLADMEPLADGTVNEQCWQYAECSALEPFVQAGKPILNVEYANEPEATVCPQALAFPMATMHTDVDLDGNIAWACWQYGVTTTTTATSTTTTAKSTTTTAKSTTTNTTAAGAPPPPAGSPPPPTGSPPPPTGAPTSTVGRTPTSTTPPTAPPRAPEFTSPSTARATVGHRFSFQVTASGNPSPNLAHSALPSGLRWAGGTKGRATISGVPNPTAAGLARVLLSATNASGRAHQSLTIRAQRRPGVTNGSPPPATVGRHYRFAFRTYGYPAPSLRESGKLPAGLAFTRNRDGHATLSGVPAPGSGGAHHMSMTVSNPLGKVTVHYVLVVRES
jgi:hypothetical protein